MPTTTLRDVELYYESAGQGRALLLTHGFGCSAQYWEPQLQGLADRCLVVAYDARGHARSSVPADEALYDETVFVEDVRHLMDNLGFDRAVVGGLSMGGNISVRFGLAHPERVDGLIVCNAGTGSDDPAAWLERCQRLATVVQRRGLDAFAEMMLASPPAAHLAAQGPEAAAWMRSILTAHQPDGLIRVLLVEQARRPSLYSLEEQLRDFTKPVLVVVGEHDEPSLGPSRFLAETLPNAELYVMAGAGHLTSAEQPELFNEAVGRFLAGL